MSQISNQMEKLLNHPEVKKRLADENHEITQRRHFISPICPHFKHQFSIVENTNNTFFVDPEARKQLPGIIDNKVQKIIGKDSVSSDHEQFFKKARRIGIVFSGGPAPGGHNVIAGLFDAAKNANPDSRIFGFLLGPDGVIENETIELTKERIDRYRNLGGFSMINTGRTKIDSVKKMALARETCLSLQLDALVIVGGDDSNTNAAFLAQELLKDGIQVIGVPKTIDGDVQVRDGDGNVLCAMSFGFHSAARSFSQQISNLSTDGSSDIKYWHVCKVMGRVASHLALEVALQTHANMTLIGEDIVNYVDHNREKEAKKNGVVDYDAFGITLRHLSRVICDAIVRRAAFGKNYGILVIPEGILEFVNEIQKFIIKLNTIIAEYNNTHDIDFHSAFPNLEFKLEYLRKMAQLSRSNNSKSVWNTRDDDLFCDIPEFFREDLLMERDSHGNFPFSMVETEKVLMGLVKDYLKILKEQGTYKIGINEKYYKKTLVKDNLDPDQYGPVLFHNWDSPSQDYLLMKKNIISLKTLKSELIRSGKLNYNESIPEAIETIYKKSTPKFKTQLHFYGYDGRGSDPTRFDCIYTYNLGYSVFHLIANGATGQMAAIRNIEKDFSEWEPIGIPLAPLMHLEERKGKLNLVIERTLVDVDSPSFQTVKYYREKWLAASPDSDHFRKPIPIDFREDKEEDRPITLFLNAMGDQLFEK